MSHKVLIAGTAYTVAGGDALITGSYYGHINTTTT